MQSSIEIALINAVCIVPLALLAKAMGHFFRRPALTHTLWVLVLIKLITPPLWQLPLVDHDLLSNFVSRMVEPVFVENDRAVGDPFSTTRLKSAGSVPGAMSAASGTVSADSAMKTRPRSLAEQDKFIAIRQSSPIAVAIKWLRRDTSRQFMLAVLLLAWGIGGLVWFVVQGLRCVRFRWSLSRGNAAPEELQALSARCARRLGLSQSPTVWLMPGIMSPMLWGSGNSSLLIFPELLLERLDEQSTSTLLFHELAHYRRRDHWVRVLALMVTGMYWWHPVVWWARREIESSEEECCDAVVFAFLLRAPETVRRGDFGHGGFPGGPSFATSTSRHGTQSISVSSTTFDLDHARAAPARIWLWRSGVVVFARHDLANPAHVVGGTNFRSAIAETCHHAAGPDRIASNSFHGFH